MTLRALGGASNVPVSMELLEKVWEWLNQFSWDWKLVPLIALLLGAMTFVWRILNARRRRKDTKIVRSEDRAAKDRQHLCDSLKLMDELIESQSADYLFAGLSSDVPRSSELLADKDERRRIIMRELEGLALQLPHDKYEEVAADLLTVVRSLSWDEWRAIQLKGKIARLINPKLLDNSKDDNALDDDAWNKY